MKIELLLIMTCFIFINCKHRDVNELFNMMEIEDKCGQMTQVTLDVFKKEIAFEQRGKMLPIDYEKLVEFIRDVRVGSILNTFGPNSVLLNINAPYTQSRSMWQKIIRLIHEVTLNSTRLKIPVLYGIDSIQGASFIDEAIIMPQQINQAATFNIEIPKKIGRISATETRALGIPWSFSPVLDVGRQPLWSRLHETYGEDPFLGSRMAEAFIRGHQGESNNLTNRENAATCLKHYIGYSYSFNGRDKTPAYIPENLLREIFLPTFVAGVKAGAPTVMLNTAEINGVPGHANSFYVNEILKGELKFDGFVVSDWEDVIKLHTRNKVAENIEEAVKISVMAGLDMSMVPFNSSFFVHCVNLAKKDAKFMNRVNDATKRILNVKKKLGLLDENFENIFPVEKDLDKIGTEETDKFNLEAARESIILAKNVKNILPLDKNSNEKILVTGPTGNLKKIMHGGAFTWQGDIEKTSHDREIRTLYQAIANRTKNVIFKEGANLTDITNINEVLNEAKNSDYIILCLGEEANAETIANTYTINLPEAQLVLSTLILQLAKPTILVYYGGRPKIITNIVKKVDGVILAFLPGNKGGDAVADIIFNYYNPNGKLPITYPENSNGFITYDFKPSENFDKNIPENQILFSFGHGLSYTKFEYSNLKLDKYVINMPTNQTNLTVSIDIKNIGNYDGKETVILYVNDEFSSLARPVKQVKGFTKVALKVNETIQVKFLLNVFEDLSFIDITNKKTIESGFFNIYIGDLKARFELKLCHQTVHFNSANHIGNKLSFISAVYLIASLTIQKLF